MSTQPQFGFLYLNSENMKLFTHMVYYGTIKSPTSKFITSDTYQFSPNFNFGNQLTIRLYTGCCSNGCTTHHIYIYASWNNAIKKFITENPNIKHDTWEDLINIETDYDDCTSFHKDYYDRLLNMGIPNPNDCGMEDVD
jgi:hypothetical protein